MGGEIVTFETFASNMCFDNGTWQLSLQTCASTMAPERGPWAQVSAAAYSQKKIMQSYHAAASALASFLSRIQPPLLHKTLHMTLHVTLHMTLQDFA